MATALTKAIGAGVEAAEYWIDAAARRIGYESPDAARAAGKAEELMREADWLARTRGKTQFPEPSPITATAEAASTQRVEVPAKPRTSLSQQMDTSLPDYSVMDAAGDATLYNRLGKGALATGAAGGAGAAFLASEQKRMNANIEKEEGPFPGKLVNRSTGDFVWPMVEEDGKQVGAEPPTEKPVPIELPPIPNPDTLPEVSDKGIRQAQAQYESVIDKLRSAGVDTSSIDREAAEARRLFEEAKSRNERLELAQLIGQSLARFGAYAIGKETGQLIAPHLDIPSVDYGKRTANEQDLYAMRLRELDGKRRGLREDAADRYRTDLDKARASGERVGVEKFLYEQKRREAADAEERAARGRKEAELEAYRQQQLGIASKKLEAAETASDRRERAAAVKEQAAVDRDLNKNLIATTKMKPGQAVDALEVIATDLGASEGDIQKDKEVGFWGGDRKRAANLRERIRMLRESRRNINTPHPPTKHVVEYRGQTMEIDSADLQKALADGARLLQ